MNLTSSSKTWERPINLRLTQIGLEEEEDGAAAVPLVGLEGPGRMMVNILNHFNAQQCCIRGARGPRITINMVTCFMFT